MIIWLASYPRSGNTLLRTIIKNCFDISSFADEPVNYESEFRTNPDLIGHCEYDGTWDAFYQQASSSKSIVPVKTHLPPKDERPYIYVVRDGRSAIQSYRKFNKDYNRIEKPLTALILGDDAYGDWSSHYSNWNMRSVAGRLILTFDELVNLSEDTLKRIADMLRTKGPTRSWKNPVEDLARYEPNFFNRKSPVFHPREEWTVLHQHLFDRLHGYLMVQLGFYKSIPVSGTNVVKESKIESFLNDLIQTVEHLMQEKSIFSKACEDRLSLIHRLQGICDERLALINQLHNANRPDTKE
jgi:hypothetical protein